MKINKQLMEVRRMPNAFRGMFNAERRAYFPACIFGFSIILGIVAFFLLFCFTSASRGDEIPDEQGIRCIIGEAAGEGFEGLLACADALQNRGTTKGVYGCQAKHIDREPAWVWEMARKAWLEAKTRDVVFGATCWGSIKIDKDWVKQMDKKMIKTIKIKDHVFYKERS